MVSPDPSRIRQEEKASQVVLLQQNFDQFSVSFANLPGEGHFSPNADP
jgi:hypothetical protein